MDDIKIRFYGFEGFYTYRASSEVAEAFSHNLVPVPLPKKFFSATVVVLMGSIFKQAFTPS